MDFFDPHFHVWDISDGTASGHDAKILFAPGDNPVYTLDRYEAEFEGLPDGIHHAGGVFLEAVSVCHVDMQGTDPAFVAHCKAEAAWAAPQLAASEKTYVLVPTCPLESPAVGEILDEYAKVDGFRGIRQIINKDPDWPRNGKALGDPMLNADWVKGLQTLAARGLSFDCQLNPHQYSKFAEIYSTIPDMTVIVNHLGCPTMKDLTDNAEVFWDGLTALAEFKNCYIKLSMLCYTEGAWDTSEVVVAAVKRVIDIFGVDRCMFASNYPVDIKDGWPAGKLFPAFLKLVDHLDADAKAKLFADNAKRAYRV
mmetsp:Transcript_33798/g.88786  ORF Transcript_33798/g.88786 Transcript_33798/m.88786 type:complete len:310 (+) Transcript_33798:140-1069(+)